MESAALSLDLALALDQALAAARASCPGVILETSCFITAVVERLPADVPAVTGVATLDTAGIFLACACSRADPAALALFEDRFARVIARAIAVAGVAEAERPDVAQIVRQRTLVGSHDRPARIASYAGTGELGAWVRVVAAREASRWRARKRIGEPAAKSSDDELAARIAPNDPELAYLKRRYRGEFKAAFELAIDELDARDRLVLRQHVLDRLGVDELAAFHHVHRATAARWVVAAREQLVTATQRAMMRQLHLTPHELASLMRLIHSELEVSLPRLLGGT